MHRALELKGLNHYEVSERAGLHKNYLWASFNPKRRKGNINDYKRISDMIGLNFTWLLTEEG